MSVPLDCSAVESWEALLTLPPEQQECCVRHLESCQACRVRLDQAEGCWDPLLRLARQVGDPTLVPADPTLSRVMERLREARFPHRTEPSEPPNLSFLGPADRPGVLGILGDYEVSEVIGQGGMGIVLKAFEPALHRVVAIKVLAPALVGSATARRRFTREARAAAAVCHDHIVTVHGVCEEAGFPYLVMQYIAGESLQARLDRTGPLEVPEIVRIGMQTASGLAAAHAQGLIHRDIKPANLLLQGEPGACEPAGLSRWSSTTGGCVKITDFGLARTIDDIQLTQDGVVAGTPEYMAPEQARGEPVDHRADLFSLGSVLYALCTGRPPFHGPSAVAVLRQVSDHEPAPIRSLNPDVPAWLEAVVTRLLAKAPADRFQSAAEVAALLESYLAHLRQPEAVATSALPPSPLIFPAESQGERQKRGTLPRFPFPLLLSCGLLITLLLAGLGIVTFGRALLPLGGDRDPAQANVNPPEQPCDVWSVAISPDGKNVASGAGWWNQPGEIGIWDLATRQPLQRFAEDLGVASVAFSADGKLLASGSWSGHVRVYEWGNHREIADFPVPAVARVAFSPDGQLLATAAENKTVQLWDVARGQLLADLEGDLFRFQCVAFSPDGKRVLAGGGDWKKGGVNLVVGWDVASKEQVLKLIGHQSAILSIAFSPDGKTIATGAADSTLRLWNPDSGASLKTLRGHGGGVESVAFSPDGKTLVSGGHDHTIRFWDAELGREKGRVIMPGEVRAVRFTPDGTTLIAGGGRKTLKFFDAASHGEVAELWNGAAPQKASMDDLPTAEPPKARRKGWLAAALIVGLLIGSSLLILLVWQRRRQRRLAAQPPTRVAPEVKGAHPTTVRQGLSFPCPGCEKNLKARPELNGKRVKCPHCGKSVRVPETGATESGIVPSENA